MPFKHNSAGISAGSTFPTMPDGWYTFKIKKAEEQTSKRGHNMILAKCSPVNEPEFEDVTIWHYVVFIPKGEPGDGISVQFRKAIGVAYGGDDVVDASEWVGRTFDAYIVTEKYDGKDRNKISQVREVGSAPTGNDEVPF